MGLQINFGNPKEWVAYDTHNQEEIIRLKFEDNISDKQKWKQIYTEVAKYYFKIEPKMNKRGLSEPEFIKWFLKENLN